MKILVIGTGSIGKRHIDNLVALGAQVLAFSYRGQTDTRPHWQGHVQWVADWSLALRQVDAVVIANGTAQHMAVASACAQAGVPFFIEKPLSHQMQGVDALLAAVEAANLVVEAGFMMRWHPNLRWIRDQLATRTWGAALYMRASVGQWLPDWRPGTDHRQGYGAFRASGGGVIFDLIHELDLVYWMLGPVADVNAMVSHDPRLEIETEAVAQIGLKMHSGALAQVHLDYVRPVYGRELEVVCEHGVVSWHYGQGTVTLERPGQPAEVVHRIPAGFERNTMFLEHMGHFLKRVAQPSEPPASSLPDAAHVLRVAIAAHQSAHEQRQVKPYDANFSY
jgi:predicted dehydrogenase